MVGAFTACSRAGAKFVFGMTFSPLVFTFFASWKSEATIVAVVRPTGMRGAAAGSGKSARPATGS
jgi:hypothetical protein